mmetsp:Transcript_20539/g.42311  ORF Transcript_20539/g.42311 Transcript_20539/m.42311 type:complete len:100 (-) Transcript_20539:160-459(-)
MAEHTHGRGILHRCVFVVFGSSAVRSSWRLIFLQNHERQLVCSYFYSSSLSFCDFLCDIDGGLVDLLWGLLNSSLESSQILRVRYRRFKALSALWTKNQ